MTSELYFRFGELEGFTSIKLADKRQGWATPIRELLQNSLDASDDDSECKINIYIDSIKTSDIPHINEYKQVLEQAIRTQERKKSYNANAEQQVKFMQDSLLQDNLQVLMFVDNGSGMSPDKINGLLDERSVGKDAQSAGSYGVGHLSCYSLSSLRYVLYATKYKNSHGLQNLFTGSPILAGHEDDIAERSGKGRILKRKPTNEQKPEFNFPDVFPEFMQSKMDKVKETGSLVAILGLSEKWDDDAEYAIVSNYFHAIEHGALSITIDGQEISGDRVKELITSRKDNKRRMGDNILSGGATYQAWQTVSSDGTQQTIPLSNAEKVYVCIKTDAEFDSTIVLIRKGMVIARHDCMLSTALNNLRKNPNFEPFTAVIDVASRESPKLFALVKGAENPFHNKLQAKRLSVDDEKQLKELLEELKNSIEEHLNEIKRESFELRLFMTSAEHAKAQAATGATRGQSKQAKPQSSDKNSKTNKPDPVPSKPRGRKAPKVTSRRLQSSNAVRYEDLGYKWNVYLRIMPDNYNHSKDRVLFSVCLGEDHDKDKVETYLELQSMSVNNKVVNVIDKKQVELDGLVSGEEYNIVAEVKKPPRIGNMVVSLWPLLKLQRLPDIMTAGSKE